MNAAPSLPAPTRVGIFPAVLSGRWQAMLVGTLLLLYFVLALSASTGNTNVFDEPDHIVSGCLYWLRPSGYQISPENGVAAQAWSTLPLMLEPWVKFPALPEGFANKPDSWELGLRFLFANGNDPGAILLSTRAMTALLGVALGALVFFWSRGIFGAWGGLISLTLFVFSPTMLANGALATTDMSAALGFFAATFGFWKVSRSVSGSTLIFSILAFGFLVLSKMSSPLIVPVFILILLVRLLSRQPVTNHFVGKSWESPLEKLRIFSLVLLAHLVCVVGLLWIFYNFSYLPFGAEEERLKLLHAPDFSLWHGADRKALILQSLSDGHLLPAAYLDGLSKSLGSFDNRSSFLCGQFSMSGWWWFFPFAFLIKTPISTLGLLLLSFAALVCWKRRRKNPPADGFSSRPDFHELTPLLILGALYGIACLTSHINIGHRHMMPLYPVLFVLAGANAFWLLNGNRNFQVGAGFLLLATAIESFSVRPHYLAFFNQFVGGPSQGYHYLVDSSLDWGQDLPGLHEWLEKNMPPGDGTPVYLSYFGSADPRFYGIDATYLQCFFRRAGSQTFPLKAGIYCISATMLQSVYGNFHRPWTAANENWYGLAKAAMNQWNAADPVARAALIAENGQKYWDEVPRTYGQLRFARLCAYLRHRTPDAEVGYSILIYRLSDADVSQALDGPPPLEQSSAAQ